MNNPSLYTLAIRDCYLHRWLTGQGLALSLWGVFEMYWLMGDSRYFWYATMATIGAFWWANRMDKHAEYAVRRAKMYG